MFSTCVLITTSAIYPRNLRSKKEIGGKVEENLEKQRIKEEFIRDLDQIYRLMKRTSKLGSRTDTHRKWNANSGLGLGLEVSPILWKWLFRQQFQL